MKIGIAGAGIAGRMLAWRLALLGHKVTLFDKNNRTSFDACSFAAAGILSPLAELEMAEVTIYELGQRSMGLYPEWLKELTSKVFFRKKGSLVTAHSQDKIELEYFSEMLTRKMPLKVESTKPIPIGEKEKELSHLGEGFYLADEGQIDPIGLMQALEEILIANRVDWKEDCRVESVQPYAIETKNTRYDFDWVFDCRGLGSKEDNNTPLQLRAVRGELLWLHAPEVNIEHVTRLMHPRYKLYIVPRPENIYLVGATEIESEDYSPISVRSNLELLSAAYSVHKGFGEARVIKSVVNCRPALANNLPLVKVKKGFGQINGLYRHGILLSPALIEKTLDKFMQLTSDKNNNLLKDKFDHSSDSDRDKKIERETTCN